MAATNSRAFYIIHHEPDFELDCFHESVVGNPFDTAHEAWNWLAGQQGRDTSEAIPPEVGPNLGWSLGTEDGGAYECRKMNALRL